MMEYISKGRTAVPAELKGLLRSEWEILVKEACLGERDAYIAMKCLAEKRPQFEVAEDLQLHRMTISDRLKEIRVQVLRTAQKMNMI